MNRKSVVFSSSSGVRLPEDDADDEEAPFEEESTTWESLPFTPLDFSAAFPLSLGRFLLREGRNRTGVS